MSRSHQSFGSRLSDTLSVRNPGDLHTHVEEMTEDKTRATGVRKGTCLVSQRDVSPPIFAVWDAERMNAAVSPANDELHTLGIEKSKHHVKILKKTIIRKRMYLPMNFQAAASDIPRRS